jgi:hypothetical protein
MRVPRTVKELSSKKILPARYISWLISERIWIGPVVGKLKTMEIMVVPETSCGST